MVHLGTVSKASTVRRYEEMEGIYRKPTLL